MDNVDAALKSSFRKDVAVGFSDDFSGVNSENVNFPEDFSVDELFDFSDDVEPAEEDEEQETEQDPVVKRKVSDESSNFSSGDDSMSFPTADLFVPLEDLAELEWLSNFVEDSFPETYAAGVFPAKPDGSSLSAQKSTTTGPPAENPSTTIIRTKRRRSQSQNRFFNKPVEPVKSMETNGPPAVKRQKRRKQKYEGRQAPRKCGHCGVQKTPQWREGPTGAKTLCNACGVRFKSGRLLPEYRPACSPTFSSELHSNSHRKVLEMRRQKEMSSGRVESSLILPGCA